MTAMKSGWSGMVGQPVYPPTAPVFVPPQTHSLSYQTQPQPHFGWAVTSPQHQYVQPPINSPFMPPQLPMNHPPTHRQPVNPHHHVHLQPTQVPRNPVNHNNANRSLMRAGAFLGKCAVRSLMSNMISSGGGEVIDNLVSGELVSGALVSNELVSGALVSSDLVGSVIGTVCGF